MKAENCNRKKIVFVTLARFDNSQNVKMFEKKQNRDAGRLTEIVESCSGMRY